MIFLLDNSNIAALPVRPEELRDRAAQDRAATVMLSPAGDAEHNGRTIDSTPERNITLALAHALKNQLEQLMPRARIIITHGAHDVVRPLANANFSNRIDADLYLSLHCYQEEHTRPELALYTFSRGDYAPSRTQGMAFYPYDQAHLFAHDTTKKYVGSLEKNLKQFAKQFDVIGSFEVPFKPLVGIKAPAIGIEIGLKNKLGWQHFVMPLAEEIAKIVLGS